MTILTTLKCWYHYSRETHCCQLVSKVLSVNFFSWVCKFNIQLSSHHSQFMVWQTILQLEILLNSRIHLMSYNNTILPTRSLLFVTLSLWNLLCQKRMILHILGWGAFHSQKSCTPLAIILLLPIKIHQKSFCFEKTLVCFFEEVKCLPLFGATFLSFVSPVTVSTRK